jgi:ribosomal L7/L12-like protein
MLATLEPLDFAIIAVIVIVFAGSSTVFAMSRSADSAQLRRLEGKLNLILKHLGLEYKDAAILVEPSAEVKALADDPSQKIQAIKLYREQTGLGLKESKEAIEAYVADRG